MKATELRIGNLVNYFIQDDLDERIEWWEESIIDANDLVLIESGIYESYEPIPITEQWLLDFGFRRFGSDFVKKAIIIHTRKRGYVLRKSVPILDYVHKLQNLYFALTGEELMKKSG